LKAFKASCSLLSIENLLSYLQTIDFKYPYHQAIGFYLEKAGFPEEITSRLFALRSEFDFYIDYHIDNQEYDSKWKLYYPRGFDL
jgi:hypothetical protein